MAILKKQPKNDVETLQAQRDALAGRLVAAEKRAAGMDPLDQWEELSLLTSEIQSLERAIATADARIAAAGREQAAQLAAQREQERSERAATARLELERAARAVCDQVQALAGAELAELRQAAQELAANGDMPTPAAALALEIGRAVDRALAGWRSAAPVWLGLPEPPTLEEQNLADRQRSVAAAEARLEEYRRMQKNRNGQPRPDDALMMTMARGLAGAKASLLRLTDPNLTPHELTVKANSGIPELAGWLGAYWERYHESQRKERAQQNAQLA